MSTQGHWIIFELATSLIMMCIGIFATFAIFCKNLNSIFIHLAPSNYSLFKSPWNQFLYFWKLKLSNSKVISVSGIEKISVKQNATKFRETNSNFFQSKYNKSWNNFRFRYWKVVNSTQNLAKFLCNQKKNFFF